jgi:ribosome-binding protein aMBF1 (putative translation factor)
MAESTCSYCHLHQYLSQQCRRCGRALNVECIRINLPPGDRADQPETADRALPVRIGAAIRSLRSRRGISQEALAKAAKTGRSTISRMECGHLVPSLSRLLSLARLCGLTSVLLRLEQSEDIPARSSRKSHRS